MKLIPIIATTLILGATAPSYAVDAPATGIIGLKIRVADYDKAMAFYSKLGLKAGTKFNAAEQEMLSESPQSRIRLILVHDESGRMKLPAPGGAVVMNVPDIRATLKELKDAGYPDIGEPRVIAANMMQVIIKDPDGNEVEMLSPGMLK